MQFLYNAIRKIRCCCAIPASRILKTYLNYLPNRDKIVLCGELKKSLLIEIFLPHRHMLLKYKTRNFIGNILLKNCVNKPLLDRIKLMDTNPFSEEAKRIKRESLSDIIHFHSPNFEEYRGVGIEDFQEFPVINKETLRSNPDLKESENFRKISTSGSTGMPFNTYWSRNKDHTNKLEVYYFNRKLGIQLGHKMYFLRIWNEINRPSYFSKKLRNYIPIDVAHLTLEETEKFIEQLEADKEPKFILGYGSALDRMFSHIKVLDKPFEGKITAVISMAEPISAHIQTDMAKWFNAPIVSRYSNSENGLLAHSYTTNAQDYFLNEHSFHVEMLDLEKDEPVENGTVGRIVVTDFFNKAIPFIRYDTGDVGVMGTELNSSGNLHRVLHRIEGRKLDLIAGKDGWVSPHSVDYALRKFHFLNQFQLVQHDLGIFTLNAKMEKGKNIPRNLVSLEKALRPYLGDDAEIKIEEVQKIKVSAAGKHRMVLNELNQKARMNK